MFESLADLSQKLAATGYFIDPVNDGFDAFRPHPFAGDFRPQVAQGVLDSDRKSKTLDMPAASSVGAPRIWLTNSARPSANFSFFG